MQYVPLATIGVNGLVVVSRFNSGYTNLRTEVFSLYTMPEPADERELIKKILAREVEAMSDDDPFFAEEDTFRVNSRPSKVHEFLHNKVSFPYYRVGNCVAVKTDLGYNPFTENTQFTNLLVSDDEVDKLRAAYKQDDDATSTTFEGFLNKYGVPTLNHILKLYAAGRELPAFDLESV